MDHDLCGRPRNKAAFVTAKYFWQHEAARSMRPKVRSRPKADPRLRQAGSLVAWSTQSPPRHNTPPTNAYQSACAATTAPMPITSSRNRPAAYARHTTAAIVTP